MRNLIALTALLTLTACTAEYQIRPSATVKLDRQRAVFVIVPADGRYADKVYHGSGQTVAQAVASAFAQQSISAQVGQPIRTGYVVTPIITHWEHRATPWSGRPSVMALTLTVSDAETGRPISTTAINGRSASTTLFETSPEALLVEPLERYVGGLY